MRRQHQVDNSNPQTSPQPNTSQPMPQPATIPPQTAAAPQSSNKMIMWLGLGLILIVLLAGGVYLFIFRQQAATSAPALTQQPIVQAPLQPEETIDALDRDLEAVKVDSTDNDFSSIDQDLKSL